MTGVEQGAAMIAAIFDIGEGWAGNTRFKERKKNWQASVFPAP
jgi:hypothetical protein